MKNLKKVLALVVVFAMMMTTVAFASYPDVDADADYAAAVELLSALEILQGDDQGNFNPDNTITRAEFAAVVCRALGLENSANSAKGATMFTDVAADHWATGYINLASQQGIVNGKGNGIFDPEGNVTFAEAVKMLVVAIGYEPMAAQRGGYPTGYLTVANSTKMTAGVSASGTDAAALRSTVAMLTANALEIPMMDQTGYGTEVTFEILDDYDNYQTLLTNRDIYVATGVVGETDYDQDTVEFLFSEASDDYEFGYNNKGDVVDAVEDGEYVKNFEIAGSNIEAYYQQNVKAYVYKASKSDYEVIIAVPSGIGSTLTIDASDLATTVVGDRKTAVEYYETAEATKTTKIYTEDAAVVYVNGVYVEDLADLAAYVDLDATVEFVENTDDKYYDIVLVTVYENAIVKEVDVDDPENSRIVTVDNSKIKLDFEDDDKIIEIVDAEGNAIELADFQENDVISMVVGDKNSGTPVKAKSFSDKIKIINLGQSSVTGTVTEASDDYIYIDGTEYEVGAFVDGNGSDVFDDEDVVSTAKLGTEGMFFISATGKIIGFDGTAGSNANYGYILQTNYDDSGFSAGWEIKMLTVDGIATYTLYTTITLNGKSGIKAESLKADEAAFADFTVKSEFADNADERIVEYKLTANGELKTIDFLAATAVAQKEFKENSYKIDGKTLADDVVIFDVSCFDADDAKAYDISYLVDEGEYAGFVADEDDEWNVFVMTVGSAKFAPEAALMYVESVRKSTYGADDAVAVKYYTEGSSELQTAIFVDTEVNAVAGADYANLSKGDVFIANMNADGLVSEYAIVAELVDEKIVIDEEVAEYLVAADDEVAFVVGYVAEVDKKGNITLADTTIYAADDFELSDFKVGGANEYNFNTKIKNNAVQVTGWDSNGVDEYDEDNGAYYVFVKFFEGDVIDIYSIGFAQDVE